MEISTKQIFFSHTWKKDNLGRDNHKRAYELSRLLKKRGWTTWVDEDDMDGNIDAAMANGIDGADVVIVCLTEEYCKKVNETARDPRKRDNCLKEWTYATIRNKLMLPVIMEPCLYNVNEWPPGVVLLYFGSTLYLDATKDDLSEAVIHINKSLLSHKLRPQNCIDLQYNVQNKFVNEIKKKLYNPNSNNSNNMNYMNNSDRVSEAESNSEVENDPIYYSERSSDCNNEYDNYDPRLSRPSFNRRRNSMPHRHPPPLNRV